MSSLYKLYKYVKINFENNFLKFLDLLLVYIYRCQKQVFC